MSLAPHKKYDHAFVVIRYDGYGTIEESIGATKLFYDANEAEAEVKRLNGISRGSRYFSRLVRIPRTRPGGETVNATV